MILNRFTKIFSPTDAVAGKYPASDCTSAPNAGYNLLGYSQRLHPAFIIPQLKR
jgi:hypothetical protein